MPLLSKHETAPSVVTLHFDASMVSFTFQAGQWADVYLTDEMLGRGSPLVAGFSMSSSPSETKVIEFSVKKTEHPVTQYFHDKLQVAENVTFDGGHGNFFWSRAKSESLVLIGGGIGMTPLLSILRLASSHHPDVPVTFVYRCMGTYWLVSPVNSAATRSELLFHEEITQRQKSWPSMQYIPIVTREPNTDWKGRQKRVDKALLDDALRRHDVNRTLYYLCGPVPLIKACKHILLELGVPKARLCYEKWKDTM